MHVRMHMARAHMHAHAHVPQVIGTLSAARDGSAALLPGRAAPGRILVCIGYCRWGRGQLQGEMMRGSWRTCPAKTADLFEGDQESLWERLRQGERLTAQPSVYAD